MSITSRLAAAATTTLATTATLTVIVASTALTSTAANAFTVYDRGCTAHSQRACSMKLIEQQPLRYTTIVRVGDGDISPPYIKQTDPRYNLGMLAGGGGGGGGAGGGGGGGAGGR